MREGGREREGQRGDGSGLSHRHICGACLLVLPLSLSPGLPLVDATEEEEVVEDLLLLLSEVLPAGI